MRFILDTGQFVSIYLHYKASTAHLAATQDQPEPTSIQIQGKQMPIIIPSEVTITT